MAELDTSSTGAHTGKKDGKPKPKKLSTRVDLTPMVDLGFLLITFFVFTTTMSQSTAMNLNEPKDVDDKDKVKTKESATMTILTGKDNQVYYYEGQLDKDKASEQFKVTDYKGIREQIVQMKKKTNAEDLMFIIKSDDESTFGNNIAILDEMKINLIKSGHYADVAITETEKSLIQMTEEANGIK